LSKEAQCQCGGITSSHLVPSQWLFAQSVKSVITVGQKVETGLGIYFIVEENPRKL
jgi:hypothetical protein